MKGMAGRRVLGGFLLGIGVLTGLAGCKEQTAADAVPIQDKPQHPPASAAASAGRERMALLIGNSDYSDEGRRLDNPGNDANDLAAALQKIGFSTQVHLNLKSREALNDAVKAFAAEVEKLNGIALVYFAGHGIAYDGKNYLLPTGPHYQYLDDAEEHGLDANYLLKLLGESGGRVNVLILDACRNMALPRRGQSSRAIGPGGLIQMQASAGSLLAFSTSYGATAADGAAGSRNSPYAAALIRTLEQGSQLDLHSYFNLVRQQVQQQTNGQQLPKEESALYGITPSLAPMAVVAAPVPQPPAPTQPAVVPQPPVPDPYAVGRSFRDCTDSSCPEMVVLPSGSFTMGSPEREQGRFDNEGPQHQVTINYRLAVGKHEVTFDEWDACSNAGGCSHRPDDKGWGRGRRPVINVSWNDTQEYVRWLSQKTGKQYRLLSEAEWEYAARAGTSTPYSWGYTASHEYANYGKDECCGGFASGRDQWEYTARTGSFPANAFGLHDMHGNVTEWVQDCKTDNYSGAPTNGVAVESNNCAMRLFRGGSWVINPRYLRSALRIYDTPDFRSFIVGFRVARTLP
jgi:formylglycine-generating enzyme required for sulfatase activity